MSKLIYIVIISVLLGVCGNMWWENKKEVDRLNQEFTEYKKKTDEKMKVVDSLQKEMYGIRTKFAEEQNKAMKDATRGYVVAQKPKLVEKQLNDSFKEFTEELKEATK